MTFKRLFFASSFTLFLFWAWSNFFALQAFVNSPARDYSVWGAHAQAIVLVLLLLFTAGGVGFSLRLSSAFSEAFSLGSGVLGLGLFFLGSTAGYSASALAVFSVGAAGAAVYGWRNTQRPHFSFLLEPWTALPLALAGLALLVHGCEALAPPTEWDILAYHLALPKLYLSAEKLIGLPWLIHSHWPHAFELLYLFPLKLHLDAAAALLHLAFTSLLAVVVYQEARALGIRQSIAAWAGTMTLTHALAMRFAGTAHVDGAVAGLLFLSLRQTWRLQEQASVRQVVLAGLLLGFSISFKLTSLVYAVPLFGWLGLCAARRRLPLSHLGLYALACLLPVLPWLLKTSLLTGNPVWPFGSGFFSSSEEVRTFENLYRAAVQQTGSMRGWTYGMEWLLIPVLGVMGGGLYRRLSLPSFMRFGLVVSSLGLLPFLTHSELWRFAWPLVPWLVLAAGFYADRLTPAAQRPLWALPLLAAALVPLFRSLPSKALYADLGVLNREAYLSRAIDIYPALQAANTQLSRLDKVLLFQDIRGYYLNVPYQWGDPANQPLVRYDRYSSPDQLAERLQDLGISHVLYFESRWYNYGPHAQVLMRDVIKKEGIPLWTQAGTALYRLSSPVKEKSQTIIQIPVKK